MEYKLTRPRTARVVFTFLIDSENRTKEFGSDDEGIDIAYVVFGGKTVSKMLIS
jgi:hypothetical protein